MNWSIADFVVMGAVLAALVAGLVWLFVGRDRYRRGGIVVGAATPLLLLVVNGAVGIIGEPDDPANAMFLVVIGFALAGAVAVRFRSAGLGRVALLCAALMVAVLLLAQFGRGDAVPGIAYVLALPWLASALLLRRARSSEETATRESA